LVFLREGILPAAVVSFFSAYGSAYSWRWVIPWAAALAAGVFLHGRLVVAVSVLLFFALQLAVPILLARGLGIGLSLFSFLTGSLPFADTHDVYLPPLEGRGAAPL